MHLECVCVSLDRVSSDSHSPIGIVIIGTPLYVYITGVLLLTMRPMRNGDTDSAQYSE
jgi:hypothetical protein